ncbi:MAG: adenylyl-sulfate kinase [Oscillospiraceae bacterium]|nr:adenylyl-sulfate kinase [Oscillospiraceae bacterium]
MRWSGGSLSAEERTRITGRKGLVVWMTGLSGSGKTTIAEETERRLLAEGIPAFILDGDKLRHGLCNDLGFSDADRSENIRRTAESAKLFRDSGTVAVVTLISPFRSARDAARKIVGDDFVETYVKASLDACISRDPKSLYKKALAGEIRSFTGIDSPYEEPENSDLVLDTESMSEEDCVEALISAIKAQLNLA